MAAYQSQTSPRRRNCEIRKAVKSLVFVLSRSLHGFVHVGCVLFCGGGEAELCPMTNALPKDEAILDGHPIMIPMEVFKAYSDLNALIAFCRRNFSACQKIPEPSRATLLNCQIDPHSGASMILALLEQHLSKNEPT